jgi:hypothetical protein
MHRKFYNETGEITKEDSGLWILNFDYIGSSLFMDNEFIKKSQRKTCDGPNCGLPYLIPVSHMLDPRSVQMCTVPQCGIVVRATKQLYKK